MSLIYKQPQIWGAFFNSNPILLYIHFKSPFVPPSPPHSSLSCHTKVRRQKREENPIFHFLSFHRNFILDPLKPYNFQLLFRSFPQFCSKRKGEKCRGKLSLSKQVNAGIKSVWSSGNSSASSMELVKMEFLKTSLLRCTLQPSLSYMYVHI